MANTIVNLLSYPIGKEGYIFDLPVKAAKHIYAGSLVCQLTSGGLAVPYSTASSEHAVGVATHEQDNTIGTAGDGDKRIQVETKRMFAFINGASSDAFADTDAIGAPVYGTDDHTVAKTSNSNARKPVGFFMGFEADGKVRVYVDPIMARLYATLMALTDAPATADALRDNIVAGVAI
jgi:hypothetical protein